MNPDVNFYSEVIDKALQNEKQYVSPKSERVEEFPPYEAFQKLVHFFESSTTGEKKKNEQMQAARLQPLRTMQAAGSTPTTTARTTQKVRPVVILAFDEAHTLTKRRSGLEGEWSVFNELRHALRGLHAHLIFSIFLSTTGKISQFSSTKEDDLSKRVIDQELTLIQPFSDLGFDHLATIIALDGNWDLDTLTCDDYISTLGRPLFGSRYKEGNESVKRDIITFAAAKLLNANLTTDGLTTEQKLACLSQRLPIEFYSITYIAQTSERRQVEGHLRICLKIDNALQSMVTTSSSEPLLSEAAYAIMKKPSFKAPHALKTVMDGFSISRGDRGEFVALLMLILARDDAVGPSDSLCRPQCGSRVFGLADFLYGHLFLKQDNPSELVSQSSIEALEQLADDFPLSFLHLNHFVKVHEQKAINITSLLLLAARGAGVLCANNQTGLDAIVTFLQKGRQFVKRNGGVILAQIKNDQKFSDTPDSQIFAAMDAHKWGILDDDDVDVPVIKIVFALAAVQRRVVRHEASSAPIYEIWCTGLSSKILGPISDEHVWDALLQASYGWKQVYQTSSKTAKHLRQSVTPGAALDDGHYVHWANRTLEEVSNK